MKKLLVIGIGAGDPDYLTLQAVKAIGRTDVFFILGKGEEKQDLVQLRQDILGLHAGAGHRVVEARDPARDRTADAYAAAVEDWRARRADVSEQLIRDELRDGETGAFLVWGDPSLYDSTLAIIEDVLSRGTVTFEYEVIPGISSVSALASKHRTGLNRIGRPVQITTGRRLARTVAQTVAQTGAQTIAQPGEQADAQAVDNVVVMLDAHNSYAALPDPDAFAIFWGAYIGTPDEILISGRLTDVAEEIRRRRAEARERKGWIMDTYLLRRDLDAGDGASAIEN